IRDLGSKNGTYVNGMCATLVRAPERAKVQLGRAVLSVEPADAESQVELWPDSRFGPLVGQSVVMRELFATLARVAASDATVLVLGETGTGKERVAQAIHEASPRRDGPFVIVDCAALPEQLLQAELFGHAKGAFPGAAAARAGAIESADGGTVFLDEIGELPLAMQPALLRVLESRTVRRLGESGHRRVDVRFVSATHRDLRSMVTAGAFREDLYFRIAVLPVAVPPLRERMDDVALLVDHFRPNLPADERDDILAEALDRPFLGNVRELRNFVDRAAAFGPRRAAAMADAPLAPPPSIPSRPPPLPGRSAPPPREGAGEVAAILRAFDKPYREFRDEVEREYVERLLRRHGGNVSVAAQAAGLDRTYIHRLIKKHRG
ncbi:MAG TPA: sigma 54-dependent Fis family transcriptional regulator, partial [Minicystis sp.]|nr:sigma 54-dependent Fis family transcriptional regulator [Minicystis sp.]